MLRAQCRFAEAIPEYETVLAYNRNWLSGFFGLGPVVQALHRFASFTPVRKLYTGSQALHRFDRIEETAPLIERAIRLSLRDPAIGVR